MNEERICANCGDTFIAKHPRQKYCRKIKIRICPICGKQFEQLCEGQISSICSDPECLKNSRTFYKPHNSKICKICGENFIPKSPRQSYCGNTHIRICKICGKSFEYKCEADSDPETCYDCRGHLFKRTCKICGKEFTTTSPSKQICDNPHYRICEICGKEFQVPNDRYYETNLTTCSKECSNIKRSRSIKAKQKMLKPGWNSHKTVHHRMCKWCGEPFDTTDPNKLYCDRKHYNVCSVCGKQFEVSLQQIHNKTSVCSRKCRDIKSRRSFIHDHIIYTQWEDFEKDPRLWISNNFDKIPTYKELSDKLHMSSSSIQQLLERTDCSDCVTRYISTMEQEVFEVIEFTDRSIEIIHNDRCIIGPKELDLFMPRYQFAIECNPTISHNSSIHFYDQDYSLSPSYHKMKTDLCEDKGIFLFHIFGYEWAHKRPIIESMIRNILGKCESKIYARKCIVKEVDSKTASRFLNDNHRQGSTNSSVRLGLYYEGELVSLMTFGKMRRSIGTSKNEDLSDCWELIRFCPRLNTSVIGGASKLFKHFVRNYQPARIRSFSDRAHTRGTLYQILGFNEIRRSDPGYVWVDTRTDVAYHRYNAQKQNIKAFLHDESIDLSQSESQIMLEHGFVKVFDSGTTLWEWKS